MFKRLFIVSCLFIASCTPLKVEIHEAIDACYENGGIPILDKDGMRDCKCINCLPVPIKVRIQELEDVER